tara:strand:+ start:2078 stop:2470 length:393 start_codon:yes stop_codon:yes gene_type:complete
LQGISKICKNVVTRHAEMDAINKIKDKKKLKKASLWSIRYKKVNGKYILGNAKPCIHCRNLAMKWGIKHVYYSDDNGQIQKENIYDLKSKLTMGTVIHLRQQLGFRDILYTQRNSSFNPNALCINCKLNI